MKLRMTVIGYRHRSGWKPEEDSVVVTLTGPNGEFSFPADPAEFPLGAVVTIMVVEPDL